MRISIVKLPALFGVLYAVFTAAVLLAACIFAAFKGFSLALVAQTLFAWEAHWWWLSILGGLLHFAAYLKAINTRRLLIANTIGICVYVAYALIPNYSFIILLVHLLVIYLIMNAPSSAADGKGHVQNASV